MTMIYGTHEEFKVGCIYRNLGLPDFKVLRTATHKEWVDEGDRIGDIGRGNQKRDTANFYEIEFVKEN